MDGLPNEGWLTNDLASPTKRTFWILSYCSKDGDLSKRFAIFISIEGMGTNLIGAYGNSVAPTPCIDSLAGKAILLDQLWNDSSDPHQALSAWWTGVHGLETLENSGLPSPWRQAMEQALLVTDSESLVENPVTDAVSEVVFVQQPNESEASRDDQSEDESKLEGESKDITLHFEGLLQAALATWHARKDEFPVLWIHSQGLAGPWDAPYEMREMLCDEDDPKPPHGKQPLELFVNDRTDPDEIFQISCAVGGQSMAIDQAIGEFYETLKDLDVSSNCLLGIIGTNGFPLGEHGVVGAQPPKLYSEVLHAPCILHPGNALPLGIRQGIILQPNMVGGMLNFWFDPSVDDQDLYESVLNSFFPTLDGETTTGLAIAKDERSTYIKAPAWSMIVCQSDGAELSTELYAKPDDRWEQNDVSSRAAVVVEKMLLLGQRLEEAYSQPASERTAINWLDDDLTQLHR